MSDLFVLSYDAKAAKPLKAQLDSFIDSHRLIEEYKILFDGLILLESKETPNVLGNTFKNFFDGWVPFFVARIGGNGFLGLLTPESAEWLEKKRQDRSRSATLEKPN